MQLAVVAGILERVLDDPDLPQARREESLVRFRRLSFSAVKALSADPDIDPAELGVWSEMGGEGLDPWQPLDRPAAPSVCVTPPAWLLRRPGSFCAMPAAARVVPVSKRWTRAHG